MTRRRKIWRIFVFSNLISKMMVLFTNTKLFKYKYSLFNKAILIGNYKKIDKIITNKIYSESKCTFYEDIHKNAHIDSNDNIIISRSVFNFRN